MTTNQWKLLEILDRWGGHGTIEVETQFVEYAPNTDAEDDMSGFRKTRLVVAGLMRSLVKRGLATDDDGGYDITEKGRAKLAKRALPKVTDLVEQTLWWDESPGEWMVTTKDRNGKERDYSASITCCDPETLNKKLVYECESKISGPGRVVTAIGEVVGDFE